MICLLETPKNFLRYAHRIFFTPSVSHSGRLLPQNNDQILEGYGISEQNRDPWNKRVAFPTNQSQAPAPGSGQDPTAPPKLYDAGMKPPSGSILPPPPPTMMVPSSSEPVSDTKSENVLDIDIDSTEKQFEELVIKFIVENQREDVRKRLQSLFTSCRQGSYNRNVHQLLGDIGHSLVKDDVTSAEAKLTILSADWSSLIGPANILIIKKLVNNAKELLENRDESTTAAVTKPL